MRVIGYIPMVADLFHVGHVNILKKAKENCLCLIVGVLTDEAVAEYKPEAPVISFNERLTVVAACRYADHVVGQDKLDPSENLKFYTPDVFFSGGPLEAVEKETLLRMRCEVMQFPYYEGQSTMQIKERIRQRA